MSDCQNSNEYLHRIHIVQDYIENHLKEPILLDDLTNISGFSKYHFHRIFKSIVGESLSHYINRIKLEKSAFLLIHRKDMNITDIAYHIGFTDSAVYSRAFKNHYNISPIFYKNNYSKNCKEPFKISQYNESVPKIQSKNSVQPINGNIEIVELNHTKVIYVRYIGRYEKLGNAYPSLINKLFEYAASSKVTTQNSKLLAIYHDNPEFTPKDQLRTSICLTVPTKKSIQANNNIGIMLLPSCKYAVGHFYILQNQYSAAWDYMYKEWLTNTEYFPCDSYPFEVYLNNSENDPLHKHMVDIYIPIKPIGECLF